jgi:ABC-type uncharacterized transport system substrate-binding protein
VSEENGTKAERQRGTPQGGVISPILSNLTSVSESDAHTRLAAFRQGLRDLGWTEGRNIRIDYRFGDGYSTRVAQLARELIELQPEVILSQGSAAVAALRQHTLSIPIIFVQVSDPVAAGFLTNLAHPNGNVTGFTSFEFSISEKWPQLIKESVPSVARMVVIFDPATPNWTAYLRAIEAAAPLMGLQLTPAGVRDAEIENAINAFARAPNGGIVVLLGRRPIRPIAGAGGRSCSSPGEPRPPLLPP